MSARIKRRIRNMVSWWFVLQIVLPFTAPLQAVDVHDLFGKRTHHHSSNSPESTTTPTLGESASAAVSIAAVHAAAPARAHEPLAALTVAVRGSIAIDHTRSSSPQVQQSVLRL